MTITISSLLSFQRWSVLWARHPAKILHKSSPTSPVADIETLRARAALPPSEQAAFAVTSRLLSSFVTEALLRAIYVPVNSSDCAGLCIIVTSDADLNGRLGTPDIYGVIPLHHTPIIKEDRSNQARYGSTIWLLDPLDMYPAIYHLGYGEDGTQTRFDSTLRSVFASSPWDIEGTFDFVETLDPAFWWNRFAEDAGLDKTLQASLLDEISSSYMWQQVVYYAPPPCPSLSSPAIQWEQSLVEGHPTHPMHRARRTLPPIPPVTPGMRDWYCPRVRFAAIERSRLSLLGPFEDHVRELVEAAAAKSRKQLPVIEPEYCIMPLYDLQVANIAEKFPGAIIFDPEISLEAQGQASLRTVSLKESPLALKLAVGIKVSSAIRTISHFTANIGPRFSEEIVPKLAIDPSILYIEREISSSVCVRTADGSELDQDIAKHFTAVFRQAYSPASDEAVILVAALGETGHSNGPPGVPAVQHLLDLDTYNKRLAFFDEYTQFLVAGVIPPLIKNGLGFEAHPQNTLVRISKITGRVLGFVMRDLGGIRVHPPTLRASTGVDFTFLPEHCIVTETCEEAAKKLYHTLVFNHIQRLARVLGVHYDGSGWATFRKHLAAVIPRDSWLWPLWMADDAKSVSGKCLVRMKLAGLYRDSVYEPFPNMIQFRAAHKCL